MNEVFVYMDTCIRVWEKGDKEKLVTELYISSLCTNFSECICIILIVNLPPELE